MKFTSIYTKNVACSRYEKSYIWFLDNDRLLLDQLVFKVTTCSCGLHCRIKVLQRQRLR